MSKNKRPRPAQTVSVTPCPCLSVSSHPANSTLLTAAQPHLNLRNYCGWPCSTAGGIVIAAEWYHWKDIYFIWLVPSPVDCRCHTTCMRGSGGRVEACLSTSQEQDPEAPTSYIMVKLQ